jgi:PAS domain S-box-containing protein
VWPPTGLAIAAVLLLGPRVWPAILAGAFLVNVTTAGNAASAVGIAAGNTLEALVAGVLVARYASGTAAFDRASDMFKFTCFAGLAAPAVSATVGVTTLAAAGFADWGSYGAVWLTWWLGDALGALMVAPALVLWLRRPRARPSLDHVAEGAGVLLVQAVVCGLVFGGAVAGPGGAVGFLCIPPVVWAAYRLGPRSAATSVLLLSAIATAGTLSGKGPFAGRAPNDALLLLQGFTAVVGVTCLMLAGVVAERRAAEEELRAARHSLEHRVAERTTSLRDSEARWRSLVQSAPNNITLLDREHRITFLNHPGPMGNAGDVIGRRPYDVVDASHHDELVAAYDRVVQSGEAVSYEVSASGPQGERRWYGSTAGPLMRDGKVDGLVIITSDITDRRRTEDELRQSREALDHAQRVARLGSWEWDIPTGRVTWSDTMWDIHGYTPGSFPVTFERAMERVDPDDAARIRGDMQSLFAAGKPARAPPREYRLLLPNGEERWLHGEGQLLAGPDGKVARVVGTVQDITERRAAEAAQRRAEAQERELEKLRELDHFKSELLNAAAHELNTPLTPIKLQLDLLRSRGGLADQDAKSVEVLRRNIERLAVLVQDILESARLQSGRLEVRATPVDLNDVVREAFESYQEPARAVGLALEFRPAGRALALADPQRIHQVLLNLLSNAWKFTPSGGRITVETFARDGEAVVRVSDTGIGLRPEDAQRLFQPFSQLNEGPARGHGTGLGLFICKGIVELHGGRIWVESGGPGKGAAFSFALPSASAGLSRGQAGAKR